MMGAGGTDHDRQGIALDAATNAEPHFDAVPDALLALSPTWHIVRGNAAARTLLGRNVLDNVAFADLLAQGEWQRWLQIDSQRASGWSLPGETRLRFLRPDGTTVPAEVVVGAADPNGVRIVSARDVSRLERAEGLMAQLAVLGARGRTLEGPDALLDASAPVFEALDWTVALTEIVEGGSITRRILARADDPVGQYGRAITGVFKPAAETAVISEVVRRGTAMFLDNVPALRGDRTSGAVVLSESMMQARVARSAWCPIYDDAQIRYVLGVTGRDLTEHDFVAIQLFAAEIAAALRIRAAHDRQMARERLAALGEMAAVVAHEVRSPIAAVLTASDALRRWPTRTDLLDVIYQEALRLRQMSTDMLAFGSPTKPKIESVPLEPLVRDVVARARLDPTLTTKDTPVQVTIESGAETASADAVLLRRALLNLVSNALEHVVASGRVEVKCTRDDVRVRIRVWNEGPPLRPEVAEKVFEPFFTTREAGTGLGLPIVRRIASDLGGSIVVDETTDGVAFSLFVPAAG